MKYPKEKIKSKFHHSGTYQKKRSSKHQKGAFGSKKKLEAWELPDDPKANNLPKCRQCGLPTKQKDSYGNPLCEFCKDDYKEAMRGYWR